MKTLIFRGSKISSSYKAMHLEFEFLIFFFMLNGFPLGLINSAINFFLCNKYNPVSVLPVQSCKIYLSMPYFGQQSEKLKTELLFYFLNILRTLILT